MATFGMQYQLNNPSNQTIPDLSNIIFNTPLILEDPFVSYDSNTGTFTFTQAGFYLVEWFVVLKTGLTSNGPKIVLAQSNPLKLYPSTNYMTSGQLSGSALVIASANSTLVLQNRSGGEVSFPENLTPVANITLTRVIQNLNGIEYKLTNRAGTQLTPLNPVPYDGIVTSTLNPVISNNNGLISLNYPGVYTFDWSIQLNGSGISPDGLVVQLRDATGAVQGISSNVVVIPGGVTGTAILEAAAPINVRLVCLSTIVFANISLQSTLRVTTLL